MRRGEVYDAFLDPTVGAEQAGRRPVVIMSRDALNAVLSVVIAVPCTTFRGRRVYPSQAVLRAGEGGLTVDSVVLCEQVRVLSKNRLKGRRGSLSLQALGTIEQALRIALDLPSSDYTQTSSSIQRFLS